MVEAMFRPELGCSQSDRGLKKLVSSVLGVSVTVLSLVDMVHTWLR